VSEWPAAPRSSSARIAVTLEAEAATLRLFDNHLDLQQRIFVIAPHPDDAEIAAFGLYADRQASVGHGDRR